MITKCHMFGQAVHTLLPHGVTPGLSMAQVEDGFKDYVIWSRLYVSEHLTDLCDLLAKFEEDARTEEIHAHGRRRDNMNDEDSAVFMKTLLMETGACRLLLPVHIPRMFTRILHRTIYIATATEREASRVGINRSDRLVDYFPLLLRLCALAPEACHAAMDEAKLYNFKRKRTTFVQAIDAYFQAGPDPTSNILIGWLSALMRLPIDRPELRSPFNMHFPRGHDIDLRYRVAKSITDDYLKQPMFKQAVPAQGCCHCGRRTTKVKLCGACRMASCKLT